MLGYLQGAGVAYLLDVRLRPLSRKPGLSKKALVESCNSFGIEYVHDKRLGTPVEMLARVRANGGYEDWDEYAEHLEKQQGAISDAIEVVESGRTALLCYEANPQECHRLVVASYLSDGTGMAIEHL